MSAEDETNMVMHCKILYVTTGVTSYLHVCSPADNLKLCYLQV